MIREGLIALAFFAVIAASLILPLAPFGWESIDEIDFIDIGHTLDAMLHRDGAAAVVREVSLEPDIGRIRPVTYVYLWLCLSLADYTRPLALAIHAVPIVLLGWLAYLWMRRHGVARGVALASACVPLVMATQEKNWTLTIHAEPLIALTGLLAVALWERGAVLSCAVLAGLCLFTKEPGIAVVAALGLRALADVAGGEVTLGRRLAIALGVVLAGWFGLWRFNRGPNVYVGTSYEYSLFRALGSIGANTLGFVQELWLPLALLPVWLAVSVAWAAAAPAPAPARRTGLVLLGWALATVLVLGPWSQFSMKNYFPALVALAAGGAVFGAGAGRPAGGMARLAAALCGAAVGYVLLGVPRGAPRGALSWQPVAAAGALAIALVAYAAALENRLGAALRRALAALLALQVTWAMAIGARATFATARGIELRSAPVARALAVAAADAPRGGRLEVFVAGGRRHPLAFAGTGFYGRFLEDQLRHMHRRGDLTVRFRELEEWDTSPPGAYRIGGPWRGDLTARAAACEGAHLIAFDDFAEAVVDPAYFASLCLRGAPALAVRYEFGRIAWLACGSRQVTK